MSIVGVKMIGLDQTALTTKVFVERCVVDVMHQETKIVSTVLNTPIRTPVEHAYVMNYGTLNGATFHTRPVPSNVRHAIVPILHPAVQIASKDST